VGLSGAEHDKGMKKALLFVLALAAISVGVGAQLASSASCAGTTSLVCVGGCASLTQNLIRL